MKLNLISRSLKSQGYPGHFLRVSLCCITRLSLIITTIFLSACAQQLVQRSKVFREADFQGFDRHGSGSVVGRAYVQTSEEDPRPGDRYNIDLVPVNAYTNEMVNVLMSQNNRMPPVDPRFLKYRRREVMDINGNFAFHGVPSGEYWVATRTEWGGEEIADPNATTKGSTSDHIPMYARVSVKDDQTILVTHWQFGRTWAQKDE